MTKWIDVVKKHVAEAKKQGKKVNLKEILPKAKVEWAAIKKNMGLPASAAPVKKSKKGTQNESLSIKISSFASSSL